MRFSFRRARQIKERQPLALARTEDFSQDGRILSGDDALSAFEQRLHRRRDEALDAIPDHRRDCAPDDTDMETALARAAG